MKASLLLPTSVPTALGSVGRRRTIRRPVRRVVEIAVLLAIAGVMASEFLVEGWLVPIVVFSGSMATTLLGPHHTARCPNCGMPFTFDAMESGEINGDRSAGDPATGPSATCPNCGRRGFEIDQQTVSGDRFLVDRGTFLVRKPRRWEVAVFRCPELARDYCVKRIVGLPGETIEIRGGDVYVDGAIARKNLAQQRALAVLVHDTDWVVAGSRLPNRWTANPADGWRKSNDGWRTSGKRSGTDSPVWLDYVNWRRLPGASPTIHDSPVLDEDAYNQTTSRQLNAVTDLMLVCRLSASGHGTLLLKAYYGPETFQITIAPATGAVTLARGDQALQMAQAAAGMLSQSSDLVLSLIDRQIILAIDGREVFERLIDVGEKPQPHSTAPFSIGGVGLGVQITRLQVWRDVYYTPPRRSQDSTFCRLGPDEYFVLGDNSPISRDSRAWTGGKAMPEALLVGRPLIVFRRDPVK